MCWFCLNLKNSVWHNKVWKKSPKQIIIIRRYFDTPPEEIECLDWYASRIKDPNYITLSHMAKDYFSIQATSVSSEQMFSIAKHTLNPIRNRLDPEKAQASLCL